MLWTRDVTAHGLQQFRSFQLSKMSHFKKYLTSLGVWGAWTYVSFNRLGAPTSKGMEMDVCLKAPESN